MCSPFILWLEMGLYSQWTAHSQWGPATPHQESEWIQFSSSDRLPSLYCRCDTTTLSADSPLRMVHLYNYLLRVATSLIPSPYFFARLKLFAGEENLPHTSAKLYSLIPSTRVSLRGKNRDWGWGYVSLTMKNDWSFLIRNVAGNSVWNFLLYFTGNSEKVKVSYYMSTWCFLE